MGQVFQSLSASHVILWGLLFFGGIYVLFGGMAWVLTRHVLPALGVGQVLDPRPLTAAQLRHEFALSGLSILIFGVGMIFPWGLLQLRWASLAVNPSGWQIFLEIFALAIWNDVHFWINHRLLHSRWLRKFHLPHHRSVVTTPFATYSFHPVEALMLGNVILLPMVVHDFSFWALFSVPLFSLFFNCVGHANYDFVPAVSYTHWFAASRRHHLHHACYNGNYGFQFTFMDRLFGTRLDADAAQAVISRATEPRLAKPMDTGAA
ncbi:desaturase [Advenella sp. S44]|uniref:sterol desaturase family protein n=1 Tax=Advenella sp. S44 TaxID=1982755 RepID=UPI000C2A483C|nr:sterol desaturase family protein [Advenella sp. S44]PJX26563.1 desaturase [Advenella sp. S44]